MFCAGAGLDFPRPGTLTGGNHAFFKNSVGVSWIGGAGELPRESEFGSSEHNRSRVKARCFRGWGRATPKAAIGSRWMRATAQAAAGSRWGRAAAQAAAYGGRRGTTAEAATGEWLRGLVGRHGSRGEMVRISPPTRASI